MLRKPASRLCASSISLRTYTRRPFTLDISTAKARATNWEPALRLPPSPPQLNTEDMEDTDVNTWVTTYSAFDPGMMRPLLMSGPSWMQEYSSASKNTVVEAQKVKDAAPSDLENSAWMNTYSAFDPGMTRPLLPITKQPGFHLKQGHTADTKPWPYSLPGFLQPTAGTTFEMVQGGFGKTEKMTQPVGVLQALLYGVPEPGRGEGKKGVLHKVLYGIKEEGEEGGGVVGK